MIYSVLWRFYLNSTVGIDICILPFLAIWCTVADKKKFLFRFVKLFLQTVPLVFRFHFKIYYYCLAVAIIRVTDNVRAIPVRLLGHGVAI